MTTPPPPLPPHVDEFPPDDAEPRRRKSRRLLHVLLIFVGAVIALPILALISLGVLMELHITPDSEANPGKEVDARVRPILEPEGLLDPDEILIYYYSSGIISYREDGNYFTDRRVVSYWEFEGVIEAEEATYAEIEDIDAELTESFLEDSVITIYRSDGSEFGLWVANSEGGDDKFLRRLKEEWLRARGR